MTGLQPSDPEELGAFFLLTPSAPQPLQPRLSAPALAMAVTLPVPILNPIRKSPGMMERMKFFMEVNLSLYYLSYNAAMLTFKGKQVDTIRPVRGLYDRAVSVVARL